MISPRLIFIAGANGSGKTTLTRNFAEFRHIPLLDPDSIANALQATDSSLSPIASARQVLKSASEHLKKYESFAVETTLSGKNYLRSMLHAKKYGFEVVLIYIGTENVEINLARIKNRVLAGGHDVPAHDVRRRYARSYKNLPVAIKRADVSILFDNSKDEGYRLIAVLRCKESEWHAPKPSWLQVDVQ